MGLSMSPLETSFKKVLYRGGHAPRCHQHMGLLTRDNSENFILRACTLLGSGWVTLGTQLQLSEFQMP